jgi:hypothetical protein
VEAVRGDCDSWLDGEGECEWEAEFGDLEAVEGLLPIVGGSGDGGVR